MAKVSCNYITKIHEMNITDLKNPLVFVVDMVNGFIKEGAMSDISIMDIVPSIQNLVENVHPSVFICDSHDLDAREFDSYPIHCVKNTSESEVVDELKPYAKKIILKDSTNAFHAPDMQDFIQNELGQYQDIVICGCCTDICVMQFALCMNTYLNQNELKDKRIIVPLNLCETYHAPGVHDQMKWNQNAFDLMLAAAIQVVELK